METITKILEQVDSVMYYPILIIVMALAGIYFTVLTKGVQVRLFPESIRLLLEPPEDKAQVSSLQAMLVSTASRVGTGNIVGVSTAICIGEGVAPGKAGACSGALCLYRYAFVVYRNGTHVSVKRGCAQRGDRRRTLCAECDLDGVWLGWSYFHHGRNGAFRVYYADRESVLCG